MNPQKLKYLKIGVVLFLCLSSYYAFYSIPYASATVTWTYNSGTNTATASGAGSTNFAALVAADTAGGWGKFISDATGTQIKCTGLITIGDGSAATIFSDTKKQVLISVASDCPLKVLSNSSFTLGQIDASGNPYNGCSLYIANDAQASSAWTTNGAAGNIYLYDSEIYYKGFWRIYRDVGQIVEIKGCVISCWGGGRFQGANSYIKTSQFHGDTTSLGITTKGTPAPTIDNVIVSKNAYAVYLSTGNAGGDVNVYNVNCYNSTSQNIRFAQDGVGTFHLNLINCQLDKWNIFWTLSTGIAIAVRQYTYDLTVLNGDITDFVENANVTLTKGNYRGTWLTNSSGQIDTTTQTYGWYNQTYGDTIQDATEPFTLTVTHPDWATYTSRFYITEKTKMTISMQEVTPQATPDPELYTENDDVSTYFVIGLMSLIVLIIVLILWSKQK